MESSEHNWANISETICPTMLVFGKKASWMFFFQNILTNPIISQIQYFMTSHFSTLFERDWWTENNIIDVRPYYKVNIIFINMTCAQCKFFFVYYNNLLHLLWGVQSSTIYQYHRNKNTSNRVLETV